MSGAYRTQQAITGRTKVVGVFGRPVEHSLSPAMHNAAFAALSLPWVYVAFSVSPERLEEALRSLSALGIVGVNLTIPHKERALHCMDSVTPEAQEVGAVNTVCCVEGALVGDNTDGEGFAAPLRAIGFDPMGLSVCILGAGGAARSVAFRLARMGAQLTLANRTPERAARLAEAVAGSWPQSVPKVVSLEETQALRRAVSEAALLVNATRVGMRPEEEAPSPVPAEMLPPNLLVYDLVYNPVETRLLQEARLRGCRTLNGVKMLVCQGAAAFERWTGRRPPTDLMEAAVLEGLLS